MLNAATGFMVTTTPAMPEKVAPTGCCPPFEPSTWNEREVVWHGRPFMKEHVASFFHIPLNMGPRMVRAQAKIAAAGARPEQGLMLSDEKSPWGTDLYIDVTKPVPDAEMARISGRFLTRVYDGPFRDAGKWAADMTRYVEGKGQAVQKLYFAYTTCPSCAKAYGHNYVVLFAKTGEAPV